MKRIYLLAFVLLSLNSFSQLVITEISYNPPEGGTDSREYVELYNNSGATIDLTGYTIADAFEFTFDQGSSIDDQKYLVIALNKMELAAIYSDVDIYEWTTGALNNGGETITLMDDMSNVIDQVTYDDANGWPSSDDGTDGEGGSIILCDPSADNSVGENWSVSSNATGIIVNLREIFGSAGAANVCQEAQVWNITANNDRTFSPNDLVINVGDKVQWDNSGGFHNVNGSQATYPDNPEGFINGDASNDAWSFEYIFNVSGVYQYQCDPHIGANMTGKITVVDASVGLVLDQIDFKVYPNPVVDQLIVEYDDVVNKLEIYNTMGLKVITTLDSKISMESLSVGNYIVKIYTEKGVGTKMISKY